MRTYLAGLSLAWICLAISHTGFADSYLSDSIEEPAADESILGGAGGRCGCLDACCDECCDQGNCGRRVLGLLQSDHCFDRFISPISNPFFFEDPRSLTEARGIFIENSLPSLIGSGDLQVWAGQLRGRVTDRVSIIAPRLGYIQVNQSGGGAPVGFLSSPVGVKYNFYRDVERQLLFTGGITYFIKGSGNALSNFGDGDFHIFLTLGAQIFDRGHWLSGTGFRLPSNDNWGTQLWYWSNQWDYELPNHIYPLVGVNWFHWMNSSTLNLGAPVTALDLLNLPSIGVAGTNVVTSVVGAKWKPSGNLELGSGFEFPLTNRTDILHNRLYADMIFRF
jgi:hypothetical protein